MNKTTVTAAFFVFFAIAGFVSAAAPDGLMIDLLARPELTATPDVAPRFSWVVNSPSTDDLQTAYRVLVASSAELLKQDQGDVWDSGGVESARSTAVEFGGVPLSPGKTYVWKVRTWTRGGGESDWSAPQTFRVGEAEKTRGSAVTTARYPLQQTEIAPAKIVEKGRGHYFVDFGRAAYGTIRLRCRSKSAAKVTVHLGEAADGESSVARKPPGQNVRYYKTELTLKAGEGVYSPTLRKEDLRMMPREIGAVIPFRYCEIENLPGELTADAIRQVAVHYPFDDGASQFVSSNVTLNEVWEICKYSMKATSFCGLYVDGDRERLAYEADAYINQLGHYCCDREFTLARYSHEHLITHPTWPTEWIMFSVMMAWADYMHTGDAASLRANYEDLRAKTLYLLARDDGLITTQTPEPPKNVLDAIHFKGKLKDIVDWPMNERDGYVMRPVNTVVNAFHCHSLQLIADIARVVGRADDAAFFAERADKAVRSFNKKLFDAKTGLYIDGEGTDHSSLHANMFPAAFGLVPAERMPRVAEFIGSKDMACSVYGAQFLFEALYRAGEGEHALRLLTSESKRSWFDMIHRTGTTITLEAWNRECKPNLDWNHAWGAAPANIIPRMLMGIEPIEPGFARMSIKPQPGSLTHAAMFLPTVRGAVRAGFRQSADRFTLETVLPTNTTAKIYLPDLGSDDNNEVTVDGAVRQAKREGKFLVVDPIGSGRHVLERVK